MTTYYLFRATDLERHRTLLAWCRSTSPGPGFEEVTFTDLDGVDLVDAPASWDLGVFVTTVRVPSG